MDKITPEEIKKYLKEILKTTGIKPEKIIIFGSYIKKGANFNDIDIAIISSNFRDRNLWQRAEVIGNIHWKLVNILKAPLDILGFTPQEWKKESSPMISYTKSI